MLQDILEETWIYQKIVQICRNKGLEEGFLLGRELGIKMSQLGIQLENLSYIQQAQLLVVIIVNLRFPELEELAKICVELTDDLEKLQQLLFDLNKSPNKAQAERLLLALDTHKTIRQAALQEARLAVLTVVKVRFPDLEELASVCVARFVIPKPLQFLLANLSISPDKVHAEQILRNSGSLQFIQYTVVEIVKARFPDLEEHAWASVVKISDPERLLQFLDDLDATLDQEHAERLLRALIHATQKDDEKSFNDEYNLIISVV